MCYHASKEIILRLCDGSICDQYGIGVDMDSLNCVFPCRRRLVECEQWYRLEWRKRQVSPFSTVAGESHDCHVRLGVQHFQEGSEGSRQGVQVVDFVK